MHLNYDAHREGTSITLAAGGLAPVQGDGTLTRDGEQHPLYFRARGQRISLEIGVPGRDRFDDEGFPQVETLLTVSDYHREAKENPTSLHPASYLEEDDFHEFLQRAHQAAIEHLDAAREHPGLIINLGEAHEPRIRAAREERYEKDLQAARERERRE